MFEGFYPIKFKDKGHPYKSKIRKKTKKKKRK